MKSPIESEGEVVAPDLIIKQYEIYVQDTRELLNRRQKTSHFSTIVLSGLLSLIAVLAKVKLAGPAVPSIAIAGVLVSLSWSLQVRSYRLLSVARHQIISEMEIHLPFDPYSSEWELVGMGSKGYVGLALLEQLYPAAFAAVFLSITILV